MSKNKNFDSDHRPELDEYLSKEITQYYGEDVISNIENSSAPAPPKHRRNNRLMSTLGIICAVFFLTGVIIFSGIFITSGISSTDRDKSADSDISGSISHAVESDTNSDTDNIYSSSYYSVDSDTFSSDIISELSTDTNTSSSKYESDNNNYTITDSDTNTDYRTDYFSLPEYPDEGNISIIETDTNNNSLNNPNDNVTTGKKFRSHIGIILMTLLLITAYALYHMRTTSSGNVPKNK